MKSENKFAVLGFLTAIASSLCCITPVLAILAGSSGLVSTFSWLEPFRPYFVGTTVLILGFVWYQKLRPKKQTNCNCSTTQKTPFIQTKKFLGILTVFVGLMLAFPNYVHIFFPETKPKEQVIVTEQANIKTVEFIIYGMTCSGCEEHINYEINTLTGILNTTVSYKNRNAIVKFDKTRTDIQEIEKAIIKAGYSVTDKKVIK